MNTIVTGIHLNASNVLLSDNNFIARGIIPLSFGVLIQGGSNLLVVSNNFTGFDKGTSVNNDAATNVIFSLNNFTDSQTLHAELWNPSGTIDVHFNRTATGALPGFEAQGNFWEGQPYVTGDDSNGDGFADPAGVTARGIAPPLPLSSTTPFTGVGVGAGVQDFGPIVTPAGS